MYKNILVPISPDEPARSAPAIDFANRVLDTGGRITVLTILEVPPAFAADYLPKTQAAELQKAQEDRLAKALDDVAHVDTKVVLGHAARTILDEIESNGHDSVVIASHRPGPRHFFIGSTAARVVRRAPCPVHVLR